MTSAPDVRRSRRIEDGALAGFWGTLVREAFRHVGKVPGR